MANHERYHTPQFLYLNPPTLANLIILSIVAVQFQKTGGISMSSQPNTDTHECVVIEVIENHIVADLKERWEGCELVAVSAKTPGFKKIGVVRVGTKLQVTGLKHGDERAIALSVALP